MLPTLADTITEDEESFKTAHFNYKNIEQLDVYERDVITAIPGLLQRLQKHFEGVVSLEHKVAHAVAGLREANRKLDLMEVATRGPYVEASRAELKKQIGEILKIKFETDYDGIDQEASRDMLGVKEYLHEDLAPSQVAGVSDEGDGLQDDFSSADI